MSHFICDIIWNPGGGSYTTELFHSVSLQNYQQVDTAMAFPSTAGDKATLKFTSTMAGLPQGYCARTRGWESQDGSEWQTYGAFSGGISQNHFALLELWVCDGRKASKIFEMPLGSLLCWWLTPGPLLSTVMSLAKGCFATPLAFFLEGAFWCHQATNFSNLSTLLPF